MNKKQGYIYALRYDWLTEVYDPAISFTMRERLIKNTLIERADLKKGAKVLDVGCGTGTLLIMIKKKNPDVEIHGVDGDPKVLKIAREKADSEEIVINLTEGMTNNLPYGNDSFDRVLSSLVFHHLTTEEKIATLKESYRVLKPGGQIHIADFGKPGNVLMWILFNIIRGGDSFITTADNMKGLIPEYMRSACFKEVEEELKINTVLGSVSFYKGIKF